MTAKLQHMVQLSAHSARLVTHQPEQWAAFLHTAAWNYKYPFHDQLLIFAQRSDATACAPIEVWNKQLDRWVKRGAKGIALIEDRGSTLGLRHVFDISDTQSRKAQELTLWQVKAEDIAVVAEALSNTFGSDEEHATLPHVLTAAALRAVEDNSVDYVLALMRELENSLLEGLEPRHVELLLRQSAQHAVAYMVLTRCGFTAADYVSLGDLSGIGYFNTLPTLSQLGAAVSDVAEMLLWEVESTIREQRRAERASMHQSESRSIAKETALRHNEAKTEGENEYGVDLHPPRGLSVAQSGAVGGGGAADWQVWDAAQKLPASTPEGDLRQFDAVGQASISSDGDRADSAPAARTIDEPASAAASSPGQGERADGMDGTHEQPEAAGGGNAAAGADLQLKWHDRRTENNRLPFFHDQEAINELLRIAPLREEKAAIELFFAQHEDRQAREGYVRSLFEPGQTELVLGSGLRIGCEPYANVLHLWTGSADAREAQGFYDWGVIAGHINSMLLLQELRPHAALLTVEQQLLWMEEAEEEKASAFSLPQAVIDAVLQQGSGFENGKYRIASHFQKCLSSQENAAFLKHEYGQGGRVPVLIGTDIREWHDSKGITLERGYSAKSSDRITLSWTKVQKRIGELIAQGRYLSQQEKEHLPDFQKQERARRGAPPNGEKYTEPQSGQDGLSAVYSYSQGDTLFEGDAEASNEEKVLFALEESEEQITMDHFVSTQQTSLLEPIFELSSTIQTAERSIDFSSASNFRIQEDELGHGGAKVKFARNVAAIQLLKQLEQEERLAKAEEQEILAQYVGWGGRCLSR